MQPTDGLPERLVLAIVTRFPLLEEKAILRGFCVLDMDVRIFDARGNFVKGVDSPECALVVLRGDVKTFDIVAALASVREHWGDDGTAVLFHRSEERRVGKECR